MPYGGGVFALCLKNVGERKATESVVHAKTLPDGAIFIDA
jgi:hypothetical protein